MFAVTTNGGKSWEVWRPNKEFIHENGLAHFTIERVAIDVDGTGTMDVQIHSTMMVELKTLRTEDYGKTWQPGRLV